MDSYPSFILTSLHCHVKQGESLLHSSHVVGLHLSITAWVVLKVSLYKVLQVLIVQPAVPERHSSIWKLWTTGSVLKDPLPYYFPLQKRYSTDSSLQTEFAFPSWYSKTPPPYNSLVLLHQNQQCGSTSTVSTRSISQTRLHLFAWINTYPIRILFFTQQQHLDFTLHLLFIRLDLFINTSTLSIFWIILFILWTQTETNTHVVKKQRKKGKQGGGSILGGFFMHPILLHTRPVP